MAELLERLDRTGALLSSAIDQYLDACVAIRHHSQSSFAGISRAFFDRVVSENPLVISYENKIKQAKAAIGYTTNSSPVCHINSLPPEILTRIFCTVTDTCGLIRDVGNSIPLPRYPDYLSHVCTRWRQVALDSACLWTHIDLVLLSAANRGFKSRAETFVSRAEGSPLEIHIYEQRDCHAYDHQSMLDIITLAAPQTCSLELFACNPPFGGGSPLMEHCFNSCLPGVLTKLKLTNPTNWAVQSMQGAHFIDSRDNSSHMPPSPYSLGVSTEHLDALLRPITHLQLDGAYFPWAHQAYHGLVELRLLDACRRNNMITQYELMDILASSPRLKLLHLEIGLFDEQPPNPVLTPIRLDDLEVLSLNLLSYGSAYSLLSLLAPGPKPLRLSLALGDHVSLHSPEQDYIIKLKDFFKHSNIIELRLRTIDWPHRVGPENILQSLPNLRVLILEACADESLSDTAPFPPPISDLPHLDIIYMVGCLIKRHCLVRTLPLWEAVALSLSVNVTSHFQGVALTLLGSA